MLRVELVGFADARGEDRVEVGERPCAARLGQARADLDRAARGDVEVIPRRGLGALVRGIHRADMVDARRARGTRP